MSAVKTAQDRTDAKIRYARIHLRELLAYAPKGSGDDFERSHQESFLYHLFGVRDAFLQELNLYYGCGLEIHEVNVLRLRGALKAKDLTSPELDEIARSEKDEASWLHDAKEMRDHSTHRHSVPRVLFAGGQENGQVHLKIPRSGRTLREDYGDLFEHWCNEMEGLLIRLRKSALAGKPI